MKKLAKALFVLIFVYIACSPNWSTSLHTVYQAHCIDLEHGIYDCPKKVLLDKVSFRVFPEEQVVVEKAGWFLTKYENCTIYNEENWECRFENSGKTETKALREGKIYNAGGLKVTEGTFAPEKGMEPYYPINEQMPRSAWHIKKIVGLF